MPCWAILNIPFDETKTPTKPYLHKEYFVEPFVWSSKPTTRTYLVGYFCQKLLWSFQRAVSDITFCKMHKCKNNFVLKKNLARKCTHIEKWGTHVHSCCKFPHQLKHNHEIDKLESCLILWMRTITKTMLMFYLKKSSCCKWAIPGIFFICFLSFQTEDQFNSN